MAKRVTITDVARETGVSIKTVSNVLNNTGSMREETRARVQEAIDRLGYRVNVSARAMKTGGTRLLGLAIGDFDQPFMPYLASSVVAAARERGYAVITDTYRHAGGLETILPETRQLAADGWMFFISRPFDDDSEILRQPYPLVVAGDYDPHGAVDWVTMPNVEALRIAVGELLDGGCRRIALIGGTAQIDEIRLMTSDGTSVDHGAAMDSRSMADRAASESVTAENTTTSAAPADSGSDSNPLAASLAAPDGSAVNRASTARGEITLPTTDSADDSPTKPFEETTSTLRTRGYCLAHSERGLRIDWRLVHSANWVQAGGRNVVAQLLDDPDTPQPDAMVCLNDALAIGAIHELQRRGLRVPQDVQVIGFDNVPDGEYCMPSLTTIDPHVDDYARHAVSMLIDRIEGHDGDARTYTTSFDIVRRNSTR